jgi:uncharacterized protein (TIGR03382 family)
VCTYRDGYDMATCSRTYCGNSAYNCETCPGLLDGGVDLNVPSAMTSPGSGGCQMANGGDVGFSIAFFVLGGAVLYRRRRPAYLTGA